jgi:hypothetical protein
MRVSRFGSTCVVSLLERKTIAERFEPTIQSMRFGTKNVGELESFGRSSPEELKLDAGYEQHDADFGLQLLHAATYPSVKALGAHCVASNAFSVIPSLRLVYFTMNHWKKFVSSVLF